MCKVSTGCEGLDRMLFGGLVEGYCAVLEGSAGTGKTTLGWQFLVDGCRRGEPGIAITFEEFPEQWYEHALEHGWDLREWEEKGLLKISFSDPQTFLDDIEDLDGRIAGMVEELGAKRILLDSVSHFERLTDDPSLLRQIETELVNALKREGLTSMLLKENPHVLGGWDKGDTRIAFVADAFITLRYIESQSEVKRGIAVLKMRGSDHDKAIREYRIKEGGIEVGEPFQGLLGLFAGATQKA
jgi:circadian clock protein KaiC